MKARNIGIKKSCGMLLAVPFTLVILAVYDNHMFGEVAAAVQSFPVGLRPLDITYNPIDQNIYVTNSDSNTVSVIDSFTNLIISNITLENKPYQIRYISVPDGPKLFVTTNTSVVSVIDARQHTVFDAYIDRQVDSFTSDMYYHNLYFIPLESFVDIEMIVTDSDNMRINDVIDLEDCIRSTAVAYNIKFDRIFIVCLNSVIPSHTVLELDPNTHAISAEIPINETDRFPREDYGRIAYNPVNNNMYLTKSQFDAVYILDPFTNKIVSKIPVGNNPYDIEYNPINHNMYIANYGSSSISVIDSSTNTVVDEIVVPQHPHSMVYNPANGNMYVTHPDENRLSVISVP